MENYFILLLYDRKLSSFLNETLHYEKEQKNGAKNVARKQEMIGQLGLDVVMSQLAEEKRLQWKFRSWAKTTDAPLDLKV